MKKILFLVVLFLFNANNVFAEWDGGNEENTTCIYELKYENANDFDRNILNSLGIKASDGGPLTYNSLILELTYPLKGGDLTFAIANEYKPLRLEIFSLDATEKRAPVFNSDNLDWANEELNFFNNGKSRKYEDSSVQIRRNYNFDLFRDIDGNERFNTDFKYGNEGYMVKSIASQLGTKASSIKYLAYTIEDALSSVYALNEDVIEAKFCGNELHLMTAYIYDDNKLTESYLMPMVCGDNANHEEIRMVNTCNAMYKNWEYYSKSGNVVFRNSEKNNRSVIIYGPSRYIFKAAGTVDYAELSANLEKEFVKYYQYCNYSKSNEKNYDMEKCRSQYGVVDGIISAAIPFGYTRNELLEPIQNDAEQASESCLDKNNYSECEKQLINQILSKFEKVETTIEEAKEYNAKGVEYFCDQKDTCISECLDSNSDTCKGLSINSNEDATNYCTEMCNLSKGTLEHYEEAEKERDKFEIRDLLVNIGLDFNVGGCDSYLGNPNDNINKPPAYYLQFIFNLMKYASIILLFVLSIADFAKAVTSDKDDAIKKASINAVKRLGIVIIIFFLPILIEFILKLLGIYSASTCGIK
ncbi:MAG: hypothetical protein E7163_02800 [Firmicutes bacterium]|nr:hypothetical protein [Bacillota bacterium]